MITRRYLINIYPQVYKQTVKDLLLEHKFEFKHDKIPDQSCNKYRPDFILDCATHIIVLEVDENQHSGYQCLCEQSRMVNIHQDVGGGLPVVFIRYNPDSYKDCNNNNIRAKNIISRHTKLIETLNSVRLHKPTDHLSVLYYNGHDDKKTDIHTIPVI